MVALKAEGTCCTCTLGHTAPKTPFGKSAVWVEDTILDNRGQSPQLGRDLFDEQACSVSQIARCWYKVLLSQAFTLEMAHDLEWTLRKSVHRY